MVSEAPPFWWQKADWRAWSLWPASALYGVAARHRLRTAPRKRIDIPVLCVGNLTVGGTGKTPVAIAFAKAAKTMSLKPGFLSRGHGGSVSGAHLVNLHHDGARYVGDEPMLLAAHAPTAVSAKRAEGVKLLLGEGCDFVIMDDGFQSAQIHIDYALIVIDAERGIGNGHTIPGGPMRASLVDQMRHASALLEMGTGDASATVIRHAARAGRAVYRAHMRPLANENLRGRRCLAFAGIGNPQKFHRTLVELGGEVAMARNFPDHHFYSADEARDLMALAEKNDLVLVTTTKDAIRLTHGSHDLEALHERTETVEIDVVFEVATTPAAIIEETLKAWRRRRLEGVGQVEG
ncbi:tetraacyldisaccharide 4'-kinase [Aliihoeflea aestuarii]|jgi:tetraacyldisaccharide 4'-kinase|uniref:tetraacyldisaccharide 4'-kinase n=1 Tax=Aliihoeflea aestuarii TaxID=453840 RepID=UPI0020935C13|nr:tetraacyldisaccharide 4'-kinase [Aliihoeflea aestuarii]MCO6389681.1 tetraacyldisaccharide 4'-kinase [Aliihoeflea aestuarii]